MAVQSSKGIKNTGKDSEGIFEDEVTSGGGTVFRLRDKADLVGLNKKNVAAFGQPCDFLVVSPLGVFMAEVKSSNNKTSFPLECFTRAQRAAMGKVNIGKAGHHYRIYIHNMLTDTWYIMNATEWCYLMSQEVKSVKWENLKPLVYWVF